MLLSYGLKSETADKGVAKIFAKSSFEEQFIVATWPSKSLVGKIVNSRKHSPQNFFKQMPSRLNAIAKKYPSSQTGLKLNSFSYSKAGHCKNLSDLKHKICSKIL